MRKTLSIETFDPEEDVRVVYPNFLYNVIPLLARLAPQKSTLNSSKYSATKLLNSLSIEEKALYKFLYSAKTSEISKIPQTRATSVSSAVPLVLLAYKEHYGVSYNSWDREDPLLPYLLTENLAWLCKPATYEFLNFSETTLRTELLYQASTDSVLNRTAYKLSKTSDEQFNRLPKYQRMMLLKTWIYAPEIAHANMICDVYDWDLAPERLSDVSVIAPW